MRLIPIALALAFLVSCQPMRGGLSDTKVSSKGGYFDGLDGGTRSQLAAVRAILGERPFAKERKSEFRNFRLSSLGGMTFPTAFTVREEADGTGTAELALIVPRDPETEARFEAACGQASAKGQNVTCHSARGLKDQQRTYRFSTKLPLERMDRLWLLANSSHLCESSARSPVPANVVIMDAETKVVEIAGQGTYCATMRDDPNPPDLVPLLEYIDDTLRFIDKLIEP